jgi:ABC-type dipeptide/oligopeptide/nickel transport system permease subunit
LSVVATPAELQLDQLATARPASLWRDTIANILRQRNAQIGLLILATLVFFAVFADQLSSFAPNDVLLGHEDGVKRLSAPCVHALGCPSARVEHIFGLDGNARDEFSRVIHGARISLWIGFATVGFAIVIGSLIGLVAGYAEGVLDSVLMRTMDIVLVFPSLLLAIAIVAALGASLVNAQIAIGIVAIPIYARVMRASVLTVKENGYITASRALGESAAGLIFRRILPNAITPIIVTGTLGIGTAVLEVAALSFLGLGAQPPLAEWGSMIGLERGHLFTAAHLILFPGIALSMTVFGFNLLGDGLRDALDPRLNR